MASLSFKSCFSSIDRICLLFVSFASFRGKRRRRTAPNKFVITRSNCTTACCLFQCFAFSCCVRKASDQLSIDVQSRTREILFPFARPVIFCIRTAPKSKFKGERKAFFFCAAATLARVIDPFNVPQSLHFSVKKHFALFILSV